MLIIFACSLIFITIHTHGLRCMLDKRKRGGIWLIFVLLTNVGLIIYLQSYTDAADQFIYGLPEAFVVLVVFVFGVTGANAAFAWYYLGKPDISDVFKPESGTEPETETATVSKAKQTEEP